MAHKLTDITTTFHSFAIEQVLTHTQLNEFLDYFDEQDRLSRICLSGVGIVCGFNLNVNPKTNAISISQGAGVTTDGDLIHLVEKIEEKDKKDRIVLTESIEYTHYRPYTGDKVNYHPHFNSLNSNSKFKMIPLIELVSDAEKGPKDKKISSLNLKNKIALFYLEAYPLEPDNCVGIDCDNQGIEQVNRLRVLLVDIEHVDRITKPDSLFNSYLTLESYLESKSVHVPRVILNEINTANITSLANEYQKGRLLTTSISNLDEGIAAILKRIGRAKEGVKFTTKLKRIFQVSETTNLVLFQYKYDLLKDLADSYEELKSLFLESYKSCCPDISAFPKHLLLGRVLAQEPSSIISEPIFSDIHFSEIELTEIDLGSPFKRIVQPINDELEYRHKFHKSPILLDTDDGNGRFESVLQRILDMVNDVDLTTLETYKKELITITPSNVRVPLGKRAIPFYYKFSENLIQNWDYDKRKFGRYKSTLGYRLAAKYPNNPTISNPLRYSIDPYDFYRIEGHQGVLYDDAFTKLTELKKTYSLPFDIKVLGIGVDEFDELLEDQYKCDFKDLGVLLEAWSSEQECIAQEVTSILSSFSTETPGKNTREENFFDIRVATETKIQPDKTNFLKENTTPNSGRGLEMTEFSAAKTMGKTATNFENAAHSSVTYKKRTNAVLPSINIEQNTLGYHIDQSIKTANGNNSNALAYALNSLDSVTNGWNDYVKDSTVKIPLRIIVACINLIDLIPSSISRLTQDTLVDYNIEIAKLCSYTKQLQSIYRDPDLPSAVSEKTRSMVSLLINQLTGICCSSKKLQALLEEVERRKEGIIERLNFSNFADRNPGLEHKAGVGPGQTFVLVYLNRTITKKVKTNNQFIRRTIETRKTEKLGSSLLNTALDPYMTDGFVKDEFSNGGQFKGVLLNPNFTTKVLIEKGTIIADFMLPYLCCSDCAPISFVLPKIPVSLSLSADTYCIDDANLELDLTVSPLDGIVTVVDSVSGINIKDGKLSIDGSIFPTEFLGTTLKFKVDGEATDAELLVSKTPRFEFSFPEMIGSNREVPFTVTGDDHPDFKYHWDFGDGMSSDEREPTHDYSDSGSRKQYNVVLTVTSFGGICPAIVSDVVTFIDITVIIEPGSVCKNADPIKFKISPEGAVSNIDDGPGINADKTEFDPKEVAPANYDIFQEGVFLKTITVKPLAAFRSDIKVSKRNTDWIFSVLTSHTKSYKWVIILPNGDETTSKLETPKISKEALSPFKVGEKLNIQVTIDNGCKESNIQKIEWTIPAENAPNATLEEIEFCNQHIKEHTVIIENFTEKTKLVGEGIDLSVNPPIFSAHELLPGEYNITVNGKVTDTYFVYAKPNIEIENLKETENGFAASTTLEKIVKSESVKWTFLNADNNEPLHNEILEKQSIEISYSDFFTTEWDRVKIVLTAYGGPCGDIFAETIIVKPVGEVAISFPKKQEIFCENDTNLYLFEFTPDVGGVVVNGGIDDGVIAGGTQFAPGSLAPGNYTLTGSNGYKLSFTIVPERSIKMAPITRIEAGLTTGVKLSQGVSLKSVKWMFTDNITKNPLHEIILGANAGGFGSNTIDLDFLNFANQTWTELKIEVTANGGPCGTLTDSGIYLVDLPCKEKLTIAMARIKKSKPPSEGVQALLTEKDKAELEKLIQLIDAIVRNPESVISGEANTTIVTRIDQLVKFLVSKILRRLKEGQKNDPLVAFFLGYYRMCIDVYANAFRCQDAIDFTKFPEGVELNNTLKNHFSSENPNSFPSRSIVVFDEINAAKIIKLLEETNTKIDPWRTIKYVLNGGVK